MKSFIFGGSMIKLMTLAALTLFTTLTQALPVSYPLVCRGSNQTNLVFEIMGNALDLTFAKGTKPATQGLNPGECAWQDRGLNAGEPNRFYQTATAAEGGIISPSVKFNGAGQIVTVATIPSSGANQVWFQELMNPNAYWVFEVYNTDKGYFMVTKSYRKQ
jgi:hypothetical protein